MVAQASSKLEILLSQSPECWNDRCIPAVLSMSMEFLVLHSHHLEEVTKKTRPNESTAQEAASIV